MRILSLLTLIILSAAAPVGAVVRVVATTTDLASLAREVGGDLVDASALAAGNADAHRVVVTPSMVVRISRAQVFVENGLELEIGWVPELLRATGNLAIRPGTPGYVDASNRVSLLEVPTRAVDRSMGDVHPFGNPHYTYDPVRAKRAAWNIANALRRVDPANAATYDTRLVAFYARVDAALARTRAAFAPLRGRRVIVFHKRYEYLLDRLGLVTAGSIEPLPGVGPSASHIARLIETHKNGGVSAVLVTPWDNRRLAEQVASGIGAKVVEIAPGVGSGDGTGDCLAWFETNAARIRSALAP